jgi:hypothetical protein
MSIEIQHMTFHEREHLKRFDPGDQAREVLTMIAHWHRQPVMVPFSDYAANWAAARKDADVSRLKAWWPLRGPRKIADNCSGWDSYGEPGHGSGTGGAA